MAKLTMTVTEVYHEMRNAGIRSSPTRISAGIASGAYPFGRVVSVGETGRKTIEIWRVDFEEWLASKVPQSMRTYKPAIEFSRTDRNRKIV